MPETTIHEQLEESLRHCRAGLKALEAGEGGMRNTGRVYNTHIYLAVTELAHSIEVAMKLALRNQ